MIEIRSNVIFMFMPLSLGCSQQMPTRYVVVLGMSETKQSSTPPGAKEASFNHLPKSPADEVKGLEFVVGAKNKSTSWCKRFVRKFACC